MKKILFATSNPYKIKEANEIGRQFSISFKQIDVDYPEIRDEDVGKIAREGACFVYERVNEPVIVEDTGLYIRALNGFPGPFSSFVYKKIGNQGILELMQNKRNRSASFIAAVGYKSDSEERVFKGQVDGVISKDILGGEGFGYDPIFQAFGQKKTFAQDPDTKNRISHRKKAFKAFCEFISR